MSNESKAPSRRWFVERTRDNFEDVGALSMTLEPCGALRFKINDSGEEIIYAPGSWITVFDEVER